MLNETIQMRKNIQILPVDESWGWQEGWTLLENCRYGRVPPRETVLMMVPTCKSRGGASKPSVCPGLAPTVPEKKGDNIGGLRYPEGRQYLQGEPKTLYFS